MMRAVPAIGKFGLSKACISGKTTDPVAMQKSVEMLGGMSGTQMIEIGPVGPKLRFWPG